MTHEPASERPRHELDRDAMLACAVALSDACRAALEATVDEPTAARAAGRTLGLDKTIAWKLLRIAHATSPDEVFRVLPGPRGWGRVHEALAAAEDGGPFADEVRRAVERLDAGASARGIPRSRIRSWSATAGRPPDGPPSTRAASELERVRETLTRANIAIWGVGSTAILRSFVVRAGSSPGRCAIASVTTLHGLHRTRPGPEWPVHQLLCGRRAGPDDGTDADLAVPSPDCRDLCTPGSLDDAGLVETLTGTYRTFRGDRTGPSDRVDLVFAEILPAASPTVATRAGEMIEFELRIQVPATLASIDVLLDRDIPWTAPPRGRTRTDIADLLMTPGLESRHHIPMPEPIEGPKRVVSNDDLRPAADAVSDAARQAHATAVQRVRSALGATATPLVRHRLRVAHPALSTAIRVAWPLPEAAP